MNLKESFHVWMFRVWYWYINRIDKDGAILFMNYGYHDTDQLIRLDAHDESNRYSVQLYHRLASNVDITNKNICEIGCGRGGGLEYITRLFSPASAIGIDLDKTAVAFSNRYHAVKGLSFLQGDAQKIIFDNSSFDVVINLESSHRYPDMNLFLKEVYRILRPDGYFLFADFRYDFEIPILQEQLQSSGLTIMKEEIINRQVVHALKLDDDRRRKLVVELTPLFLHKAALNFAGVIGSETFNRFKSGEYVYFNYILKKNDNP
jgi:ubiquinone/menaquinone biosynthesis C-methylase UbiE